MSIAMKIPMFPEVVVGGLGILSHAHVVLGE
jgi:hypothetical protein